ncbi:hypothetical protein [Stieleria marina]|uniref:Uncharacterized protein n=1 Tax=Stieleria marina TaxID=1930275 RepID=A0A517NWA9_9BACT|nr:hypothetical protein K239x_34170 [Planctomycetes bacterium K23_9]
MNPYEPPTIENGNRPRQPSPATAPQQRASKVDSIAAIVGVITVACLAVVYALDWWIHH